MAGELAYDPVTGQLVYSPATGQLALNCGIVYKLTPCVAPIYELVPCDTSGYCWDLCSEDIVGFQIDVSGVVDEVCDCSGDGGCADSPEYWCPESNTSRNCYGCYCCGNDGMASIVNGTHYLYYHYDGTACTVANQFANVNTCGGIFVMLTCTKTVGICYFKLRIVVCNDCGNCEYFESATENKGSCPISWPITLTSSAGLVTGAFAGGTGAGSATVTPIYGDTSKCPAGGSIYTQDEDTCFSGESDIYTTDDLSAYVGRVVLLDTGICYEVTQEGGGSPESVTVVDSYDTCPEDKYYEYLGKVITIDEDAPDYVCYYVSVGGSVSDGEVTVNTSYDTCNECCAS